MDDNRIKQLLLRFRRGERIADFNIKACNQKASKEEIQELVDLRYIIQVGETSLGDKQYVITEHGRQFRNS